MTGAVVIAPHPDDEVLGCSAVLFGGSTTVVHVTDGVPPWTDAPDRDTLRSVRQAECPRAWESLSSHVDCVRLGFGDLVAWQAVEEISEALTGVIGALRAAHVYLPAYQRGHPDHDAIYLAGTLARNRLANQPGLEWSVYGLYGFDRNRRLRFGCLSPEFYEPVDGHGCQVEVMKAKPVALRQFTSQLWSGSALDLWLRAPVEEEFAPLPPSWGRLPDLPCFYDEQLDFGRHGASAAAVDAAFQRVLAARAR